MIQFFIKIANNWVGKVLFAAILFGMVFVWGYGGLTNTARHNNRVITVAGQSVSLQQLDELFRQERISLSNMIGGQYISPQKAVEMGLLDNVVRKKTNEMILENIKDELGLTASNTAVQKYVERNPNFADATGHFDRNLFMAYLRQMNVSERGLAQKLQSELATQHLTRAIQSISYAPDVMAKNFYRSQNETRDITAVLLNPAKIKIDVQPTQQELQDYYDVYATEKFMTPEYRSFKYLRLTPAMMLDRVQVSDEEIDLVFDDRKDRFNTPEKRLVSQMYFANEDDAKRLLPTITPDNFNQIAATELGQSDDVTNFGYVAQTELLPELAEAVFQATPNTLIGPIESTTGWHILLLRDIQAAKTVPTNEVRRQIKQQLAQERIYDARTDLLRQVEDLLGEGKSLTEAATTLKLNLGTVKAVDISGNKNTGGKLDGSLANRDLLQNLFTLKTGDTTPTFESGDDIIIAELTEIIPVGTKSFSEVREELKSLWIHERQQEKLQQMAQGIMKKLQKGTPLTKQRNISSSDLIRKKGITRDTVPSDIPAQAAIEIFKQQMGSKNARQLPLEDGIFIVVTDKINRPSSVNDIEQVKQNVKELTGSALTEGVIATYTNTFGVSVDIKGVQRLSSMYTSEQE